jgi:hypothetical protein
MAMLIFFLHVVYDCFCYNGNVEQVLQRAHKPKTLVLFFVLWYFTKSLLISVLYYQNGLLPRELS